MQKVSKIIPVILVSLLVVTLFTSVYSVREVSALKGASEQVVTLPEDGGAYHLSLFLDDNWRTKPEQREFVSMFWTDPTYTSLRVQSHFHMYTPSDPIYKSKFAGSIDTLPCMMLQDEKGKVEFKASGDTLLTKRPWLRVRPWKRPHPSPAPCPQPGPVNVNIDTPPSPTPIPDTQSSFPWPLLLIVTAVAAGVTVVVQFARRSHS